MESTIVIEGLIYTKRLEWIGDGALIWEMKRIVMDNITWLQC